MTLTELAIHHNNLANKLYNLRFDLKPTAVALSNTESLAWDYHIAAKVEAYGKGAKDKARKEAIKAGVMFDHEKEPLPPGADKVVYEGKNVVINVKVKEPSTTFDHKKFEYEFNKANLVSGTNREAFDALFAKCFKQSRPAHTFTSDLRVTET